MERYWKSFRIGELFERSGRHIIKETIKNLNISSTKNTQFSIRNITGSGTNNGIACYLEDIKDISKKKEINKLTITTNCQYIGTCFYQDDYFVGTNDNNIIDIKNKNLENILTNKSYKYLSLILTKIFHNKFHGFFRKIGCGNDFNREIILLPVIQCSQENAIWMEDDGTFITLDTEKISEIMDKVDANKRKKTIDFYEAEKAKYELEKAKYDNDKEFLEERKKIYWKSFRIGELFERISANSLKEPIKNLDHSNIRTNEYNIPVISSSGINNGISGYIKESNYDKYLSNKLTIADPGEFSGKVFYQKEKFLFTYNVRILRNKLNINFDNYSYKFIANYISYIFLNKFHGFTRKISASNDFNREVILLPMYDENSQEKFSIKNMGYLYLLSQIKYWDNKINKYNNF